MSVVFFAIRDPSFSHFVTIRSGQTTDNISVVLLQYTHNWSSSVTVRRTSFSRFVTKHLRFNLTAKRLCTWLQSFCHNTHTNGLIQWLQDVLTSAICHNTLASDRWASHFVAIHDPNFSYFVTIHSRRRDGPVILSQYAILTLAILSRYTSIG